MSDHGRDRLVDQLLAHLEKNGSDERLRELAAGVRQGDGHLREFLAASPYSRALQPGLEGFTQWYDQLSDTERAEQSERCQREIDELNRQERAGDGPSQT